MTHQYLMYFQPKLFLKKALGIFFITFSLISFQIEFTQAQSMADLSAINVDDLSDAQIQELIRRAGEAGLSESELIQMARLRGVSEAELEKLKKRIEKMEISGSEGRPGATSSKREPRKQGDLNEITSGLFQEQDNISLADQPSPFFGMDIF